MRLNRRTALKAASAAMAGFAYAGPLAAQAHRGADDVAPLDHLVTRHRRVEVEGIDIFYREAGRRDAPALLLLHGFPTSSHMFRHLIPALADRYRVVAPDYPGFGNSGFPPPDQFAYNFASFARIVAAFTAAVGIDSYALYIQDYGAPVGLRLALMEPDRLTALITQNGNAYEEGLSPLWEPLRTYWRDPADRNRAALRDWLSEAGTKLQYSAGLSQDQLERIAPENWELDWSRLSRPGNIDMQLDLFGDYRTNVDLYPEFQRMLREHRPPTLVLWGRNDPFFTVSGARAYLRDVPDAELRLLDGSHFLLETHAPHAIRRIRDFLARRVDRHG